MNARVYKVHKVYRVCCPLRGAWLTAACAADKLSPKDTRNLMNFTNYFVLSREKVNSLI